MKNFVRLEASFLAPCIRLSLSYFSPNLPIYPKNLGTLEQMTLFLINSMTYDCSKLSHFGTNLLNLTYLLGTKLNFYHWVESELTQSSN